jgi:RNA polymerase sigma factor (sigma-70 family)
VTLFPDDHFFRQQSGRMVATLLRIFGVQNQQLAEDVVQDAFCRALEVWKLHGLPENPSAWLMAAAKNRAIDVLRRERTVRRFTPELTRWIGSEWTLSPFVNELFQPEAIQDDELRTMFSCCHPLLNEEAQVALILNVLCGFSANEIAAAFLVSLAAMEKRISRAKHVLAKSKTLFVLSGDNDFLSRLSAVQRALYLLFNEGYHGAGAESAVKLDLCHEALRLARLLSEHKLAAVPSTFALCALLALNAARINGRVDANGRLQTLDQQDRSLWNRGMIADGARWLSLAATGEEVTSYHIEAAIAYVHVEAKSVEETDWNQVVLLYDRLNAINPSPVVALNRAIAIAERSGAQRGLAELRAIANCERLASYPFYEAALGELELRCGNWSEAATHFRAATDLSRNDMEKQFFEGRTAYCEMSSR